METTNKAKAFAEAESAIVINSYSITETKIGNDDFYVVSFDDFSKLAIPKGDDKTTSDIFVMTE